MVTVRSRGDRTHGAPGKPQVSMQADRLLARARAIFGLAIAVATAAVVAASWGAVKSTISLTTPLDLFAAEALVLVALALSVMTWRRSLTEIGSRIGHRAAARVYLLGQLGKYLPGSVWALVAQAELARKEGVPRTRGFTASVISLAVNSCTGLLIGLALMPQAVESGMPTWALTLMACLMALSLAPPILTRLVDLGLRLVNRPALDDEVTWRGVGVAGSWSVACWMGYGLSVWVLAVAAGAPAREALPVCLGAVPIAMTAGLLVFLAPSGVGVREAVLVAGLSPVLDPSDGLAVALITRLLFTVGDVVAAVAVLPRRARPAGAA